jgi:hypothetical protein
MTMTVSKMIMDSLSWVAIARTCRPDNQYEIRGVIGRTVKRCRSPVDVRALTDSTVDPYFLIGDPLTFLAGEKSNNSCYIARLADA